MERLQYIRDRLIEFWDYELKLVQQAMGFRFPAQLVFDRMVLTDESSTLKMLMDLADRGYISLESLQDEFGLIPEIEQVRIRREDRARKKGMMIDRAGPYFAGEKTHDYKKAFIPTGTVTPSELGVELDEKQRGQKAPLEMTADLAPKTAPAGAPKGQPGQ